MNKLLSIQYLRAIAVILVVIFHSSTRITDAISPQAIEFMRVGGAGVDLFFIISGFIMWTICDGRPTSPSLFLLRRSVRIIPLYWLATLSWAVLSVIGILGWVKLTPEHIFNSLFFIPHYSPSYPDKIFPILVPGWTLNYEMFFYGIFAVCLMLPSRFRLGALSATLVGLVVLGTVLGTDGAVLKTYTNPLLLEFLAGVVIGYAWRRGYAPRDGRAWACLAIGVAGLVYAAVTGIDEETQRVLYWGLPSALIVLGALEVKFMEAVNAPLLRIGDASYSIYLTHLFPLAFLDIVWSRIPILPGSLLEVPVFFAVAIAAAMATGILCHGLVESPLETFFRERVLGRRKVSKQAN